LGKREEFPSLFGGFGILGFGIRFKVRLKTYSFTFKKGSN